VPPDDPSRTSGAPLRPPAWLTPRNLPEVLALVGALGYGCTYFACVLFYGPFGVDPGEVGLGYAEILGQTAVYLVFAFAVPACVVGIPALLRDRARSRTPGWSPASRVVAWRALLAGALVVNLGLVGWAIVDRARVRSGRSTVGVLFLLPWSEATVGHLRSSDATSGPPVCVVRLGGTAGTDVVYDPNTKATMRLAQAAVVLPTNRAWRCRRNARP
jgi:hypothetical protein